MTSRDHGGNMHKLEACHACLDTKSGKFVKLNSGTWLQMFKFCVDLEVNNCYVNSQFLCYNCAKKVQDYSEFKKQCHNSDKFWKSQSWLTVDNKVYTNENDIKTEYELEVHYIDQACDNYEEISNVTQISDVDDDNKTSFKEVVHDDHNNIAVKEQHMKRDNTLENLGKIYICDKCKKTYKKKLWLTNHVKKCYSILNVHILTTTESAEQTRLNRIKEELNCGLCNTSGTKHEVVRQHIEDHRSNNELNCKLCEYVGRDFAEMVTHRYTHLPSPYKNELKCTACDKRCKTDMSLQFHYRTVHLKKLGGWCTVCNKTIRTFKVWKTHEKVHKSNSYVCDHCGRHFPYKNMIEAHLRDHSEIRNFVCEMCGKSFKRRANLKAHFECIHVVKQRVKCKHCDKFFKSQESLNIHLRVLKKEKPFSCEICHKKYPSIATLKTHAFWHTNDRPHGCELCGLKYKAKGQLKIHMRKHTGLLPFKCIECEKCFATTGQLRRHLSIHTGVRRHKCLYCIRSFHTKKLLSSHCQTQHRDMFIGKHDL